jgi:dihydropteroate synthase
LTDHAVLWRCRELEFDLARRVLVMGVVNVTPDSFSDGGRHLDPDRAADRVREMASEGADLVDLGAESTRPGAVPVSPDEQWLRLEPVMDRLARMGSTIPISIDTASGWVAARAIEAGARVVNDVTALESEEMMGAVAAGEVGAVLMHMRGTPATMQQDPRYGDAAREIRDWLAGRIERARRGGVALDRIAIDPGIGFGKTARHNLELIARLEEIASLGRPVVIGASRKSFLGAITGRGVDQRLEAGLGVGAIAVFLGARIVRTHDVAATVRAVRVAESIREAKRAAHELET